MPLLLEFGDEVDATNEGGRTNLLLANQSGSKNMLVILLDHGAAVDQAAEGGRPLLHVASKNIVIRSNFSSFTVRLLPI